MSFAGAIFAKGSEKKVVDSSQWPLPESMDAKIQHMVKHGWSAQPGARRSIEDILEAQR
jgi:hypothetical protein